MSEICLIYTPCPTQEVAEILGKSLVEARLCACINIVPGMRSMYMWNGVLTTEQESLLLIKTFESLAEAVKLKILAHHPYETPAILTLPVTGANSEFLRWMKDQISS